MQYVCDAPKGKTWFRIETEGEAVHESRLMGHTVEKYFRREREKAVQSWRPERPNAIERDIGHARGNVESASYLVAIGA